MLEPTCFQRVFEFFKNISFIKKKVEYQKLIESYTWNFASIIRKASFWNFLFGYWYCTLVVKITKEHTDFFQNTCFKWKKHGGWRDLRVVTNYYKRQCLPVITWDEKHLSKQVVVIKYPLESKLFAVAFSYFWRFRVKKDG